MARDGMERRGIVTARKGQEVGADCLMKQHERVRNRMERAAEAILEDVLHRARWTPDLRDALADALGGVVENEIAKRSSAGSAHA